MKIYPIPPAPVAALLYDAVESLRLAIVRLDDAYEHAIDDDDSPAFSEWHLYGMRCQVCIWVNVLEELVGGTVPTIPARVFAIVREYKNRWPENHPASEGCVLAFELARLALIEANAHDLGEPLDSLIAGALDAVDCWHGFLDTSIGRFTSEDVAAAVLEGKPLPAFYTDDDVAAAKECWAKMYRRPVLIAESAAGVGVDVA